MYYDVAVANYLLFCLYVICLVLCLWTVQMWLKARNETRSQSNSLDIGFTQEEYNCGIYIFGFLFCLISETIWMAVFRDEFRWAQRTERTLAFNSLLHILFTIVVTGSSYYIVKDLIITLILFLVLPGRIVRMNALLNMEVLELKRVFVRYVSHEIRLDCCSPILATLTLIHPVTHVGHLWILFMRDWKYCDQKSKTTSLQIQSTNHRHPIEESPQTAQSVH